MVSITAPSRARAKSTTSGVPSSSPRRAMAPVQAKIEATELVEVSSPRWWRRKWRVTVPCAASYSYFPSGLTSTEVIRPRLPKPSATMSLITSPS